MDRRSLLDGEMTPTQERENVFADEFEDDFEFAGVADGFRPNVDRETESASRQDNVPVRTISSHYASQPITPTLSRGPSRTESIRKSHTQMNPFVSPEDDDHGLQERPRSLEFEPDALVRRSTSSASSYVYARTSSPRFGAGPSHPYGMYQQGTMARTPSVTTTSTIRPPPQQSFSHNVPQHPYSLYPQGVDDGLEDDDDDIQPVHQNPVPIGFPGLSQGYTRRIGPDGEDQDIVGEDGHTEQLPPYSRYPEDGPEKMPLLPIPLHSRAPVPGTDPGMPLMHTPLQPTPSAPAQSMTDASELARQTSRGSLERLMPTRSSSSEGSSTASYKTWKEKTWKERRDTRVIGGRIPCIWIMVAVFVIVFILAVVGGAVGGFIAGNQHALKTAATVTTYYDASPIATPTGVPALPMGTFALTLGPPEEAQSDCLTILSQAPAWNCDLSPNAALSLIVEDGPGANGTGARVEYASYDTSISYGTQLSAMNTTFASFAPVTDNDDPQNGPAFYFQQWYDKVVVVPETALSLDSSGSKHRRQGWIHPNFVVPAAWTHRREVIPPGEKPWFCVWNNTYLEGFIYVTENSTTTSPSSAPQSTPAPTNMSSQSSYSPATTADTASAPPPITATAPPDVTTTFTASWTTATYTGPQSNVPDWVSDMVESAKLRASYEQHQRPYYAGDDDYQHPTKRDISSRDPWSQLTMFPYVIKLEERRVPSSPENPYCQQYQILDNGNAGPVTDPSNGDPIIIQLAEQDPQVQSRSNSRRGMTPGGCHCQWMSGE